MKITFVVLLALPLLALAQPVTEESNVQTTETIAELDNVEARSDDAARLKRSGIGGSGGFLTGIKQNILSSVGKASASIASGSSGSSSGGGSSQGGKGYGYPHPNEVEFDGAQLKKNILNTLFQAVKAITGGVTAIKGQLIKGSGYLISGGGKLIAASGDQVTNVGKTIASSAKLVPPSHGGIASAFGASSSSSSGSSSGHSSPPSGHGESYTSYESPAVIHTGYGPPDGHTSYSSSGPSSHGPAASYGAPVDHSSTYVSTKYGPPSSHVYSYARHPSADPVYPTLAEGTASSSPLSSLFALKRPAITSAAEALRGILQRLPSKFTSATDQTNAGVIDVSSHDDNDVHSDSLPPFKPMPLPIPASPSYSYTSSQSGYSQNAGPSNTYLPFNNNNNNNNHYQSSQYSQGQTQVLSTAYGAPISDYQHPVPVVDVSTSYGPPASGVGGTDAGASSAYVNSQPLNIYHHMSLKFGNNNGGGGIQYSPNEGLTPPLAVAASNPIPQGSPINHNDHLNAVQSTLLGGDYEIQKSVSYEIKTKPEFIRRRQFYQQKQPQPYITRKTTTH